MSTLEDQVNDLADGIADELRRSIPMRGIAEHYLELEAEVNRLRSIGDAFRSVMDQLQRESALALERDALRSEVANLRAALEGIDRGVKWEPEVPNDQHDADTLRQTLSTAAQVIAARKQQALREHG